MINLTAWLVLALSAGFATDAADKDVPADKKKDKDKPTAEKLVGVWKLMKSSDPLPGDCEATLEIMKDSDFVVKIATGGQLVELSGTWKLEGKTLTLAHALAVGNGIPTQMNRKESLDITSLTEDNLVTVDKGVNKKMKRTSTRK